MVKSRFTKLICIVQELDNPRRIIKMHQGQRIGMCLHNEVVTLVLTLFQSAICAVWSVYLD